MKRVLCLLERRYRKPSILTCIASSQEQKKLKCCYLVKSLNTISLNIDGWIYIHWMLCLLSFYCPLNIFEHFMIAILYSEYFWILQENDVSFTDLTFHFFFFNNCLFLFFIGFYLFVCLSVFILKWFIENKMRPMLLVWWLIHREYKIICKNCLIRESFFRLIYF